MTTTVETSNPRRAAWLERLARDHAAGGQRAASVAGELEDRADDEERVQVRRRAELLRALPELQATARLVFALREQASRASAAYAAAKAAHAELVQAVPRAVRTMGGFAIAHWLVTNKPEALKAELLVPEASPARAAARSAAARAAQAEGALERVLTIVPAELGDQSRQTVADLARAEARVGQLEQYLADLPRRRLGLALTIEKAQVRQEGELKEPWRTEAREKRLADAKLELEQLPTAEQLEATVASERKAAPRAIAAAREARTAALDRVLGWKP